MTDKNTQFQQLISLFHAGVRHSYAKGEFIIRPGETPPGIFFIESGLVKIYDITKFGEENLLIFRKSEDLLAVTWAFTGIDQHIIYTAVAPTVVWQIPPEKFLEFLQKHPRASLVILEKVVDMYRLHSERILNLEYRTVRERLISFLLTTAARFGTKVEKGILIEVPLRHQDIASSINSSRETTSREMAYLERHGLVCDEQFCITLLDINKLKNYL
ncbi:MAG: Crp/Fnr family transcriptional regulator [Candidatus Saccharimonadales bacterium]|jgi:CRP/FNR family transcriptional regulator